MLPPSAIIQKGEFSMTEHEKYQEHIRHIHDAFCKTVVVPVLRLFAKIIPFIILAEESMTRSKRLDMHAGCLKLMTSSQNLIMLLRTIRRGGSTFLRYIPVWLNGQSRIRARKL